MDVDAQLEVIYSTAQTDTVEGKTCRDVMLSLWDDGESHGCDLRQLLSLDPECYGAVQAVLAHFYNTKVQLDQFMTTRQITALESVVSAEPKARSNGSAVGIADTYSRVRRRR